MSDPETLGATPSSPLDVFADPRSLLAIVWGGRRIIAGCLAGCLALATLYLLMANRLYEASAKLLVIEQGASPMSTPGGPSRSLVNSLEDAIPTHLAILSSPVVVRQAVETVGLNNLPSLSARSLNVETATLEVVEAMRVSRPDRLAKIVEVSYRAKSGEEALRLVRAVTESYQAFLSEVYAQSNSEVVVLMTKARDDLNRELKELEARYLDFRKKSPSVLGDSSGRTFFGQRLEEWNRASRDAMVRAVQLKAQLELGRELAHKGVGLWSIAHAMDQMAGGANNGLASRVQASGSVAPVDYLRQLAAEQQKLADTLGPQSTKVKEIQEQMTRARLSGREARNQMERGEIEELLDSVGKSLSSLERMRQDMQVKFEADLKLQGSRGRTD
ncbi:MAG: Wzz/FepE/Etk N-terminal domain-containing protein, partial [Isosphaeraceae bacterium]